MNPAVSELPNETKLEKSALPAVAGIAGGSAGTEVTPSNKLSSHEINAIDNNSTKKLFNLFIFIVLSV